MAKVRVTNTTSRMLCLPQVDKHMPKQLVPGGNNVEEDHLEALAERGSAAVEDWFERGWLKVESSGEDDPEGVPPPEDLLDYSEAGAMKLVELETDPAVVEIWRDNEVDRPKVVQAMNERLSQLRTPSNRGTTKSPTLADED